MAAIIVSKTEIERKRHLKFQRPSDTIIQSGHQFCGARKGIGKKISKFYHNQAAFCRNAGVKTTAGTPISGGNAGDMSAVSRKIFTWKCSIVRKQSRVDLFFGKYLSEGLIPQIYNACRPVFIAKVRVIDVDAAVNDTDQDIFSRQIFRGSCDGRDARCRLGSREGKGQPFWFFDVFNLGKGRDFVNPVFGQIQDAIAAKQGDEGDILRQNQVAGITDDQFPRLRFRRITGFQRGTFGAHGRRNRQGKFQCGFKFLICHFHMPHEVFPMPVFQSGLRNCG